MPKERVDVLDHPAAEEAVDDDGRQPAVPGQNQGA